MLSVRRRGGHFDGVRSSDGYPIRFTTVDLQISATAQTTFDCRFEDVSDLS